MKAIKDLFGVLIDDFKKYKIYIISLFIICLIIGVLWGLFQERKVDEYKRIEADRLNNIQDIYRDEYKGYNKDTTYENLIDADELDIHEGDEFEIDDNEVIEDENK